MPISDAERLINLELLFTHLERQVGELHAVVLDQREEIRRLERELLRLAARSGPEEEGLAVEE